jgi:hypothetical protein
VTGDSPQQKREQIHAIAQFLCAFHRPQTVAGAAALLGASPACAREPVELALDYNRLYATAALRRVIAAYWRESGAHSGIECAASEESDACHDQPVETGSVGGERVSNAFPVLGIG